MAGATSKLDILIEAKNAASPQLKAVTVDLKEMDSAAGAAAGGLSGLAGAAGVAGFVALAGAVSSAAFELGELGAQALQVEGSFAGTAAALGTSANEMMDAMHAASQGMISDQELMLGANRAMILGVASNMEEVGALLEVAGERALIMGTDVSSAFNDLVTGIGRMSPLILDNLGIVTGGEKVFDDYAASIGKTTEQLSDAEKKQALLNMAIRDTLPYLNDNISAGDGAAGSFQRFSAASDNLRVNLGELIAVKIAPWLDGITTKINALAAAFNIIVGGKPMSFGHGPTTDVLGIHPEATANAQKVLAQATEEANNAIQQQGADMTDLNKAYEAANRSIAHIASSQLDTLGASGVLGVQKDLTAELGAQVRIWQDMKIDPTQIAEVLIPGWLDGQRQITKETEATGRATAVVNAEYNDLIGKVKGVIKSALNPGVNVDPSELLEAMGFPREDAINENARRLADIAANGLKGQDWLGEFKNEVPDIWQMIRLAQNPQEEAARLLQDFQDGLLTSPIDKEKAKEIVKRSILGDQNMAALATEIATELAAEMGIPMQEALAAAQGTLGGGKGMGSEAATTFSEDALAAMEDEDGGGSFVSTFVDQARAKYSLLATAGTDAAKTWGDAFLAKVGDSVPPALVNLLTDLVTPEVVARMAQRGSLTGSVP